MKEEAGVITPEDDVVVQACVIKLEDDVEEEEHTTIVASARTTRTASVVSLSSDGNTVNEYLYMHTYPESAYMAD